MWRISDGTIVHLGGLLEGSSEFADWLRRKLSSPYGPPGIQTTPIPGPGHWLDLNDVALMNAWLEQETARPFFGRLDLRILERPENIPPVPLPEGYEPSDPEMDDEPLVLY